MIEVTVTKPNGSLVTEFKCKGHADKNREIVCASVTAIMRMIGETGGVRVKVLRSGFAFFEVGKDKCSQAVVRTACSILSKTPDVRVRFSE